MSDTLTNIVNTENQEVNKESTTETKQEDIYGDNQPTSIEENENENKQSEPQEYDEKTKKLLSEGYVDLTEDSNGGLLKKILVEGEGEKPPFGSNVVCHYVGTLDTEDKKEFDSSRKRNQPFNFPVGKERVIKGWDIGIRTMKRGEKAILRCRSDYAYGDNAQGDIPPGSTLNFEIELLDFDEYQDVGDNKNLKKHVLEEGFGNTYDHPEEFGIVNITYIGRIRDNDGDIFCQGENVSVCVDDDVSFIDGFHKCIKEMIKGEHTEFILQPIEAYGEVGDKDLNIKPNTPIYFNITLNDFDNPKSEYEMDTKEHFDEANKYKESGNKAFKETRFSSALKRYKKAVELMEHDTEFEENDKTEANNMKLKLNNNIALVYFKQKEFGDSLEYCTKVLDVDSENLKAMTRKGQCNMYLGNFKEARLAFKAALKFKTCTDKDTDTLNKLIKLNKKKQLSYQEKQRKLYENAFGQKKQEKKIKI